MQKRIKKVLSFIIISALMLTVVSVSGFSSYDTSRGVSERIMTSEFTSFVAVEDVSAFFLQEERMARRIQNAINSFLFTDYSLIC